MCSGVFLWRCLAGCTCWRGIRASVLWLLMAVLHWRWRWLPRLLMLSVTWMLLLMQRWLQLCRLLPLPALLLQWVMQQGASCHLAAGCRRRRCTHCCCCQLIWWP